MYTVKKSCHLSVQHQQNNQMKELPSCSISSVTTTSTANTSVSLHQNIKPAKCPKYKHKHCSALPLECMNCSIDRRSESADCVYGAPLETDCSVDQSIECQAPRHFKRTGICRFCYQTPDWMQVWTKLSFISIQMACFFFLLDHFFFESNRSANIILDEIIYIYILIE